uniref:helix-turn-helix domain-containing protein n=1 Tax=Polynucleobacter sp. TaxID=2029855 RepID=UPI00404745E4
MSNSSVDPLPEIEAEFIKAKRESLNISRSDLAKKLCITEAQLEQIENGKKDKFYSYQHKNQVARKVAAELGIHENDLFKRKFSIGFTIGDKNYSILIDKNKEQDKGQTLINDILSRNLNVNLVVSHHSLVESPQTLDDLPEIKPDFDKKLAVIYFLSALSFVTFIYLFATSGNSFFSKSQNGPTEVRINLSDVAKRDFQGIFPLIAESCPYADDKQINFHTLTVVNKSSVIELSNSTPSKICFVLLDYTVKIAEVSSLPINLEANSNFLFFIAEKPESLLVKVDGVDIEILNKGSYIKLLNMF